MSTLLWNRLYLVIYTITEVTVSITCQLRFVNVDVQIRANEFKIDLTFLRNAKSRVYLFHYQAHLHRFVIKFSNAAVTLFLCRN